MTRSSLEHFTQHFAPALYRIICPWTCVHCENLSDQHRDLCFECQSQLPWLTHRCQCCALPLSTQINALLCGECQEKKPPYQKIHALFDYQLPIANWISQLKFLNGLHLARLLGELLADELSYIYYQKEKPEFIIPVPLHPKRLVERGFNQAIELARGSEKKLQIPLLKNSILRVRATQAQLGMSARDRCENLKQAFQIPVKINAQYVAIIDDVITTGTTITELCTLLKHTGVKKIDVWCIARTGLYRSIAPTK